MNTQVSDLELAQEVAKRLGLEYQAQPIAWDAKIWNWSLETLTVSGMDLL